MYSCAPSSFANFLLVLAARDGHGAVAALRRELHREMAEAADALHGDDLAGSRAGLAQRIVGGNARAQERAGDRGVDAFRHGSNGRFRGDHVFRVAAVEVHGGCRARRAIGELAFAARLTVRAVAAVPADADALAGLEDLHAGPDFLHAAGDFVPRHKGKFHPRPMALLEDRVAVANAAGVDFNENLSLPWLRFGAFDEFKGTTGLGDLSDEHTNLRVLKVNL